MIKAPPSPIGTRRTARDQVGAGSRRRRALDRASLAEALPRHRYDDPTWPQDHAVCLAEADAILRELAEDG